MLLLSWSTFRQRWPLFIGAIVTVCLGVALVQSSLLTLISDATKVPPGLPEAQARALREGYAGAASLLGIIVGLSAFLAVFIVASTFAFTVAQRRREFALIRLAGGGRGQVRVLLLGEALLLGAVGTGAGVVVGVPIMRFEGWLLDRLGFVPPGFTGQWRSWVIAASTGAGVGIALLGVLAASQRASRVRPLEALLQTGQATRVMTWSRWLLGLVFLGGGIAMLTLVPAVGGDGALAMSILVCFPLVVGLAALAPLVVPLLGGLLGIIGGRSAVGHLARANIRHGVRRTASTAAPIMALVALVAGLAGTLSTVAEAGRQEATRTLLADFVVTADRPIGTELADVAGVRTVSEEMTVPLDVAWVGKNHPDAPVDALAVDPTAYLRTHHLVPTAGDLRDLHGATVAVRPNDLPDQGWRIGGSLPVLIAGVPTTLRVVALLPTTLTGSSFLVPAGLIPADPKTPRRYAIQVDSGVDLATVGARLAHFGPVVTKAEWIEGIDQDQQRTNLKVMIALLGLASLYTVIAIINAVVISASDRRDEFAVDRMTGLTRAQVVRMALSEAFTVVVAGVMLGGIAAAGTVIGNVIALTKMTGITVLSLPWPLLAWVALSVTGVVGLTSLLTTLAATRPAAHRHPGHGQCLGRSCRPHRSPADQRRQVVANDDGVAGTGTSRLTPRCGRAVW